MQRKSMVLRVFALALVGFAGFLGGCDEGKEAAYDPRVDGITPRTRAPVSNSILNAPPAVKPAAATVSPASKPATATPVAPEATTPPPPPADAG